MTFAFDQETAVVAAGEGVWDAHITPHWNIGDKPNGGYLMAVALRALHAELSAGFESAGVESAGVESAGQPDPLTLTAHFLRPGIPDAPATMTTGVLKRGRSISTVRGTLVQDGKARVEMIAGFGSLAGAKRTDAALDRLDDIDIDIDTAPPVFPPIDESIDRAELVQGVKELSLLSRVDVRVPPAHRDLVIGSEARMAGWIRFSDGRPPDTLGLPLFADAFPPSLFSKLGAVGWVPTLEMTVHVRRRPAPGWLMAAFDTHDLTDGRFIETGTLWDSTGLVVAQARQLGLLLA